MFVTFVCPNCNGALDLDLKEGITSVFCPYCGQKFLIDDEATVYSYRDEARIREAEVEKLIRLKELEIEEKKRIAAEKARKVKIIISIILGVIALIGFLFPPLSLVGLLAMTILMWIWMFGFLIQANKNNKK